RPARSRTARRAATGGGERRGPRLRAGHAARGARRGARGRAARGSSPVTGPEAVLREHLAQPDQRSCGATALVVARMLLDRDYADLLAVGRPPVPGLAVPGSLASRFRDEVLALHRRVTGPVDPTGRLQLPWP